MNIAKNQLGHILFLVASLLIIFSLEGLYIIEFQGSALGLNTRTWFIVALLTPIIHQLYVLICWRIELYGKGLTKIFGKGSFGLYKSGFFLLFSGRFITIVLLAFSNRERFEMNVLYQYSLIVVLAIPAIYTFYSVKKYFGFDRAAGIDHFDTASRSIPFVNKGIFKYTSNGMYKFAFLIFYIPGLVWFSDLALIVALFSHLYIWVHYYCTELPDIKIIYSK